MTEPIARTVKDFCRTYGIGKSKAYELMAAGTLAAVKAGARTLILEESAKAWFGNLSRTHAVSSTSAHTHAVSTDRGGQKRKNGPIERVS